MSAMRRITFTHEPGEDANDVVAWVTLVDEDFDINLIANPMYIDEKDAEAQSVVISAMMPDGKTASSATTVTLDLSSETENLINGNALGGTTSITIGAGASSASTTVILTPAADDEIYTGDRKVEIEGTSGTGDDELDISPAEITLRDDETPPEITLSLSDDDKTIDEDDTGGALTINVTATLSSARPIDSDTEVKVMVEKNTDRYTLDPESGEITITVTGGSTEESQTFILNPDDDSDYEGDVTVAITGESGTLTVKGTELTLVDEDFDFDLTASTGFITEDGGTQSVTVTATIPEEGTADTAMTLSLWLVRPDGETASSLALGGTTSLTIAKDADRGTAVITITPTDDETYQGNRTVKVMATIGDKDISPASIELRDDEKAPTVELQTEPSTLAEEGGVRDVTVTATLSNTAAMDMEVAISISDADDIDGVDFETSELEKIVVPAGKMEMSATLTVTPDNNTTYDGDATIVITHDPNAVTEGDEVTAEIKLVDDDFDIHLSASPDFIDEDGGEQSVVITASLPDNDTASSAMTLTLTSTPPPDVTIPMLGTTTITIGSGANSGSSTITLTPPNDDEFTDNRKITIGGYTGTDPQNSSSAIASTEVALNDDESLPEITLSIADNVKRIMEDAQLTTIIVTATLSGTKSEDAEVKVSVPKSDERYTLSADEFTITIGSTANCLN